MFSKFGESKQAYRQDFMTGESIEGAVEAESGQLMLEGTNLTSTLTSNSVVAAWISSAEKRGIIIILVLAENCGFCSNALRFIGSHVTDAIIKFLCDTKTWQ